MMKCYRYRSVVAATKSSFMSFSPAPSKTGRPRVELIGVTTPSYLPSNLVWFVKVNGQLQLLTPTTLLDIWEALPPFVYGHPRVRKAVRHLRQVLLRSEDDNCFTQAIVALYEAVLQAFYDRVKLRWLQSTWREELESLWHSFQEVATQYNLMFEFVSEKPANDKTPSSLWFTPATLSPSAPPINALRRCKGGRGRFSSPR